MMKYIDIEFANQPICIPLFSHSPAHDDLMEDLINTTDVAREQRVSAIFPGTLIPPTNIWRAASERDAARKPTKTKRLKVMLVTSEKDSRKQEIYIQDEQLCFCHCLFCCLNWFMFNSSDFGRLHFTKRQAEFLRLAECVRLSLFNIVLYHERN